MLGKALRVVEQLGEARDVVAVKRIGVQVAADHDRRIRRERLFDLIIHDCHLRFAALAVRAVLQMDADRADFSAADVERADNGNARADALLTVIVPVVLLGHVNDLRPADRPAREQGVAVETLVVVRVDQLDELQTVSIVHADGLGDLIRHVAVARADCAVIELVRVDDVNVLEVRTHVEEVDGLVQRLTAFDVEHDMAQHLGHLSRCLNQIVHLALLVLRNFIHYLELTERRYQIAEGDTVFIGHSFHLFVTRLSSLLCARIGSCVIRGQPAEYMTPPAVAI